MSAGDDERGTCLWFGDDEWSCPRVISCGVFGNCPVVGVRFVAGDSGDTGWGETGE